MRLILHADDFGMSDDTYRATVQCFEQEVLISASIMPLMPFSTNAIQYAKQHPEFSFGAHLTFARDTVEQPISDPSTISHLVDSDGRFMNSNLIRRRALCHQIPVCEIAQEVKAQLGYFYDHGLRLSHVDSHGHIHKLGLFPEVIASVLPHFGITKVRAVQNIFVRAPLGSPTYWLGAYWGMSIRRYFNTTKYFLMLRGDETLDWVQKDSPWLCRLVQKCKGHTLEAGFHPGYIGWNDMERRALIGLAEYARHHSISLINWTDIT